MHTLLWFFLLPGLVLATDGEFRPVVLFVLYYNRLLFSYLTCCSPPCCELCGRHVHDAVLYAGSFIPGPLLLGWF